MIMDHATTRNAKRKADTTKKKHEKKPKKKEEKRKKKNARAENSDSTTGPLEVVTHAETSKSKIIEGVYCSQVPV